MVQDLVIRVGMQEVDHLAKEADPLPTQARVLLYNTDMVHTPLTPLTPPMHRTHQPHSTTNSNSSSNNSSLHSSSHSLHHSILQVLTISHSNSHHSLVHCSRTSSLDQHLSGWDPGRTKNLNILNNSHSSSPLVQVNSKHHSQVEGVGQLGLSMQVFVILVLTRANPRLYRSPQLLINRPRHHTITR
ncbi:uncharacterized protein [Penaeus vannamei]|uniref:uncharacterized protein isoform X2 n=1 Tax=Penaeus vannamei TaxID=6689 RepID=UPI00387F512A